MDAAHVRLEFDKKKLADLVETLGRFPQALPGVISRALNRTAQSMRSHVSADAAHALGTTERLIKSRIHVSWASESKLRATVYIDEKGFSLYLFKPVQNRMGVETTRGFLASFPHAFIATPWVKARWKRNPQDKNEPNTMSVDSPGDDFTMVKAGQQHPGVYVRAGKSRFPLLTQLSPGAVATIQELGGWERRYTEALEYLETRLMAETERVLVGGKWTAVASGLNETWGEWQLRLGGEYQILMWNSGATFGATGRMSA
jgi:hypothetical protein